MKKMFPLLIIIRITLAEQYIIYNFVLINFAICVKLKIIFAVKRKDKAMKLKKGIVTNSIDGESFAIATGKMTKEFNGLIKNNSTASYIFELLKKEQTLDSIVDAMTEKYDIDEATVRKDVTELIELLKSKNLIED